jgi:hypothetical protein
MSTPVYTVEAIGGLLGPRYMCRQMRGGGVQVNLNLKETTNDYDKIQLLQQGFDKLKAAGYEVAENDVKISRRMEEGKNVRFDSWPCIFVNRPGARDNEAGATLKALAAAQANGATPEVIAGMVATLLGGKTPEAETTPETEAVAEVVAEEVEDEVI